MAIQTTVQKNNLATSYATNATHGALFTAAPPGGSSQAAANEVTATGSPAYARQPFTSGGAWSAASAGATSATVTFDVPASTTVTHAGVCSSGTQGAATVLDYKAVTPQAFSSQGTYQVTYIYTES